jgi:hypothetical protein
MFSPHLFDVVFDCASNWPEVIETSTSSIDLKSLEIDVSSFDKVFKKFFVFEEFL